MDNFHIDVRSDGDIRQALGIAFGHAPGRTAVAYAVQDQNAGPPRLVFFWNEEAGATKLPFKLDADAAADFATRWLKEQNYGREPDHDGGNKKGWRVYTDAWGHVRPFTYSFVAIEPLWAMYGK